MREGQLRFYASAGPGGFALDQAECVRSQFYCVAVEKNERDDRVAKTPRRCRGDLLMPVKPPAFATVKSTNYRPRFSGGGRQARAVRHWLTADGKHVAEGPSMNVGFVVRAAEEAKDFRKSDDDDDKTEDAKRQKKKIVLRVCVS